MSTASEVKHRQSGLYLYNVTFLNNREQRITREFFGQNLKQVILKAKGELQQEFGYNFLLLSCDLVTEMPR